MFTEILGIIIIIGIVLVLIIRHNSANIVPDDNVQTGTAANHFKRELEVTGNEILQRIDQKIDELEMVIATADKKLENLKIYSALLAEYENKKTLIAPQESSNIKAKNFDKVLAAAEKNEYGGSIDIVAPNDEAILYSELLENKTVAKKNQPEMTKDKSAVIKNNKDRHDLSQMAQSVYALLDKNMTTEEISRQLSVGRGVIDMIAKMYKNDKKIK